MSESKFVKMTAFVMYPINKRISGYSYTNGKATINIQSVETQHEFYHPPCRDFAGE